MMARCQLLFLSQGATCGDKDSSQRKDYGSHIELSFPVWLKHPAFCPGTFAETPHPPLQVLHLRSECRVRGGPQPQTQAACTYRMSIVSQAYPGMARYRRIQRSHRTSF